VSILGSLVYMAVLITAPSGFDLTGHPPTFVALRFLSEAFFMAPIVFLTGFLLARQMLFVARLHRAVVRVDLQMPGPLQAMATLTARGSIVLLLLLVVGLLPLPNVSETGRLALALIILPSILVSVAAFVLPLRGMQSLLKTEKERRMAEVSRRIDATTASLHAAIDEQPDDSAARDALELAQVRYDGLSKALASLLQEREFVARLPTWPWDTSTFRAVVSAVALPIALFVITNAIDRFLI
jgi:hypothetical protein